MAWFGKSKKSQPSQRATTQSPKDDDAPVKVTRWIWKWDPDKKIMDGYWTDGPSPEPPGLRPIAYHSAFREHKHPNRSWIFPYGAPVFWWDRRR
jgi:hypothetical protein